MLICENLSCARAGRIILEHLGFCIQGGGFLLLKGANGSGKTTLLKTLAGLCAPHTGRVTWQGEDVRRSESYKRELIYIGHANAIKPDYTVAENVRFWAQHYDTETMANAAMHYFGLDDKKHIPTRKLSAGWQRRVALSRLLLSPASVWLLDEPTNFLDAEAVALMGSLIETRIQHGGSVIVASHMMQSSFPAHMLLLEDFTCPG